MASSITLSAPKASPGEPSLPLAFESVLANPLGIHKSSDIKYTNLSQVSRRVDVNDFIFCVAKMSL